MSRRASYRGHLVQAEATGQDNAAGATCSRRAFLELGAGAVACAAVGPLTAAAQDTPSDELTALSLKQASDMIAAGTVSPSELTRACLERIERYDPMLNAFITVTAERALATARQREAELARGMSRGPLHGIPIALKDNMDTAGIRTTGGSELFQDRVPAEDAEVARRLEQAGAVLLGKLNLHEFAYGGSSTVTHFGTIRNPWAPDRATGGSSGGPGAAVAADLCYAALGTDTAGSVRIPAAHCGIVGLKPSYGRVGMRGVMTLSWTLDHVGPMGKTVEDAAMMLNAIAGYDPADPTTVETPVPDYANALELDTRRMRIGLPQSPFWEELHPEVEAAAREAVGVLEELTAGIVQVTLPDADVSGTQLWGPEAYAYHLPWINASPEKYQPSTRASLERYADAPALDYVQARREVDLARRRIANVFSDVDLLVTPTLRQPPPLLADRRAGGGNNAAVFNIFGLPAVSVPCGFTDEGLPIGLQIVGGPFAEANVLALAHDYEQSTGWHTRRPSLGAARAA